MHDIYVKYLPKHTEFAACVNIYPDYFEFNLILLGEHCMSN